MSIAPPSDIVLDVAQAADPQKLQEAQAKLARMTAGATTADFAAVLGSAAPPASSVPIKPAFYPTAPAITTRPISPFQKFEAVLLQNLVDNILPRDTNLFGDAASADINRSMMAEQLATQIARSNRIGIARMIEKARSANVPAAALPLAAPRLSPSPALPLTAVSLPTTPRRT